VLNRDGSCGGGEGSGGGEISGGTEGMFPVGERFGGKRLRGLGGVEGNRGGACEVLSRGRRGRVDGSGEMGAGEGHDCGEKDRALALSTGGGRGDFSGVGVNFRMTGMFGKFKIRRSNLVFAYVDRRSDPLTISGWGSMVKEVREVDGGREGGKFNARRSA